MRAREIHEAEVEGVAECVLAQSPMPTLLHAGGNEMLSPTIKTGLECQVLIASEDARPLCPPVTRSTIFTLRALRAMSEWQ